MRDYRDTANKITVNLSYDFFDRPLEVLTSLQTVITKLTTAIILLRPLLKKKRENEILQGKEIAARANLLLIQANLQ
jgi:hypothetical protein